MTRQLTATRFGQQRLSGHREEGRSTISVHEGFLLRSKRPRLHDDRLLVCNLSKTKHVTLKAKEPEIDEDGKFFQENAGISVRVGSRFARFVNNQPRLVGRVMEVLREVFDNEGGKRVDG